MKRREFLRLSGTATAAGIISGTSLFSASRGQNQKPNILFIIVDDLRPELGCYGKKVIKTPNIDRLAQQGVVFTRAYCQQSICNPSRTSLLTGMRPESTKVWDLATHFRTNFPDLVTLPQHLKQNGYQTVGIGKVYHDFLPDPVSWCRPEPEISGAQLYQNPQTQERMRQLNAAAKAMGKSQPWITATLRGPATESFDAPESQYWDGGITDTAIQLLHELKDKTPFFLAVGFIKPHLPYSAPQKYWDMYDPLKIPLPRNNYLPKGAPFFAMNEMYELACYEDFTQIGKPTERILNESRIRHLKHGYYACVSFIDAQIGRLCDELERSGLRENTIIVLLGDNGYKLGEHGSWGKKTNYETDTRSVLIISSPGAAANGKSSPALVEFVDVYPTLCELAGLESPNHLEGTSMIPLLAEPERPWKIAAFSLAVMGFSRRFIGKSIRTKDFRYVEWRDLISGRFIARELYDHKNDPEENMNIADNADKQKLVKQLAGLLAIGWTAARPRQNTK